MEYFMNFYADIDTDLETLLHEVSRLHVHLGRISGENISTRGWKYNELVSGVLQLQASEDLFVRMHRCLDVLFDTLDGITEIGPNAVKYLHCLWKHVFVVFESHRPDHNY